MMRSLGSMEVGEASGRRKPAGGIDWGPGKNRPGKGQMEYCWWHWRSRSLGKTEELARTARWNNGGSNSETAAVKLACMRQDAGRMTKEQWIQECNYGDARAAGWVHRPECTRNASPLGNTKSKHVEQVVYIRREYSHRSVQAKLVVSTLAKRSLHKMKRSQTKSRTRLKNESFQMRVKSTDAVEISVALSSVRDGRFLNEMSSLARASGPCRGWSTTACTAPGRARPSLWLRVKSTTVTMARMRW